MIPSDGNDTALLARGILHFPHILATISETLNHIPSFSPEADLTLLQTILEPAIQSNALKWIDPTNGNIEGIEHLLEQYPHQVAIFHLGGYPPTLLTPGSTIEVGNLVHSLSLQSNLKLVFLSGYNTQSHSQDFFHPHIPVVLRSTCAHAEASYFTTQFYRAITERHSILEALQLAVGAMKARYEQYRETKIPAPKMVQGIRLLETDGPDVPWQLYVQLGREEVLDWKLRYPLSLTPWPCLDLETECLGRETELETLQSILRESNKVVLLNGLGGIGKTTLAAGFIQWLSQEYDHIAWINSGEDLLASFALNTDLTLNLELPFIEKEELPERFARVMNKLRNLPGHNLLVIDDANNQITEIVKHLPSGANWQVLVTSRLSLPDFREMRLGVLQPEDALRLFRLYHHGGTDQEVQELLLEINHHPLTIEVMAKTLSRLPSQLSVPGLLSVLRERQLDDPDLQTQVWTRHAEEERAIFFHLMKAFELAKLAQEEIWLMQQYAVLPSIPIEVKILADWVDQEPLSFNRTVNQLSDKGWISKQGKGFSMHKMIQEVVKYQYNPGEQELDALLESMGDLMTMGDRGNPVTNNFPWVDYAQKVAEHFKKESDLPEKVCRLWNNYANILAELGRNHQALDYFLKVLTDRWRKYGPEDPIVLVIKSNQAKIFMELGLFQLALDIQKELIAALEKNANTNFSELAIHYSNLGVLYQKLGQFQASIKVLDKAHQSDLRHYGKDDLNSARSQANLALAFHQAGHTKKAIRLMEQALTTNVMHFEPNHPFIVMDQSNLASMYQQLGDFNRAEQLFRKVLTSTIQNFGPDHPKVALEQNNLGLLLQEKGQLDEAKELLDQAMASEIHNFGPEHPNVARCQTNLGMVFMHLGQFVEASELFEKALQISLLFLGEAHPSVGIIQSNLAVAYLNQGDQDRALSILNSVLTVDLQHLGDLHPNIAIRKNNIGHIYLAKNELDLAEQYFKDALSIVRHNYGRFHYYYWGIRQSLRAIKRLKNSRKS